MINAIGRLDLRRLDRLGETIRSWRETANLSQAELASMLGTTQSALSRWERGHDQPRLSSLAELGRACGLRVELVFDRDVDRAQIRQALALTPGQRLAQTANMAKLAAGARRLP
jgi:transcriptional regulator with XRE-family HTH domain